VADAALLARVFHTCEDQLGLIFWRIADIHAIHLFFYVVSFAAGKSQVRRS
jgi:hypothetical protein